MKLDAAALAKRYQKAKGRRDPWESLWDDTYRMTMPARSSFFDQNVPGEERADDIYDSTGITALAEFANRMQDAITPNFAPWFKLEAGVEIPEDDRPEVQEQLDEVSTAVMSVIQRSNFSRQIHEVYQDLAVGTAAISVEPDDDDLIRFFAAPMPTVYLDCAANGRVDGVFRCHTGFTQEDIKTRWPEADVPDDLAGAGGDEKDSIEIVEANYRDWSERGREVYHWHLFLPAKKTILQHIQSEGQGSKAWITPRWSIATGEVYGRGPLLTAMPDIRTLNLLVQMVLENAELAIAGLWQVDDTGLINPANIQIIPGTVMPRRPGTRGLEALGPATQFDVGQITIERLQDAIRQAMFNQRIGSLMKTPRSATEIIERQSDLAKQIGAAFGRLMDELAEPVILRVIYLLKERGVIELPRVDGREIAIVSKSPLARAQRLDDVQNLTQYISLSQQLFGQQAMLKINAERAMNKLAQQLEIPASLLNTEAEQQQTMQQLMQLAGQVAGEEEEPGGVPTA